MTRIHWNLQVTSEAAGAAPDRAALDYHRRLPGYERSHLREAPTLAAELDLGRLWVKDESSRLGLPSFKILGASWGVYRALERHVGGFGEWGRLEELAVQLAPHRSLALAAATDGNHGRAVARIAKLLGLSARIFVPAGTAAARIEGIESEGASCEIVDGTYDEAVARSAREAGERCLVISDTSWAGYEDVPRWVMEGYSTIFWEIEDQLSERGDGSPGLVVVQIGVGALAAAAVRHFRRAGVRRGPRMVGVEPEVSACVLASMAAGRIVTIPGPHDSIMAGLNCGTPSIVAWPLVSRGYDAYVALADERAREGMRSLAGAGIVSGETGAAGIACLLELLDDHEARAALGIDRNTTALVLSTEGATDPAAYEEIVGTPPEAQR
ncbi:MAG: diaminopropionate ammonia-lyase [Actinomycetota bacterium]